MRKTQVLIPGDILSWIMIIQSSQSNRTQILPTSLIFLFNVLFYRSPKIPISSGLRLRTALNFQCHFYSGAHDIAWPVIYPRQRQVWCNPNRTTLLVMSVMVARILGSVTLIQFTRIHGCKQVDTPLFSPIHRIGTQGLLKLKLEGVLFVIMHHHI